MCAAADEGDKFCQDLFHRAGRHLGRMANSLLFQRTFHTPAAASGADSAAFAEHHVHFASDAASSLSSLLPSPQSGDVVRCVCVGSVWQSFPLLRRGFLETVFSRINASSPADAVTSPGSPPRAQPVDFTLQLVQLEVSSAVGAAWKAAKV